jgi:predicted transposase YbfD/YdcC
MKFELKDLRRLAGMFKARLPDLELDKVEDRRRRQGRRWKLPTLLQAVIVGMAAGLDSLGELETLTTHLAPALRGVLGLRGRLADTTVRDTLVRVVPYELRQAICRMVRAAWRRGSLPLKGFPFHVVALDGKATAVPYWDHHYAQQHTNEKTLKAHGLVRTVTAALVSTAAKPIIEAVPIPAETNEMGVFPVVFEALLRAYGSLFRLVTYDAGATSEDNCRLVVEAGKDFLFRIRNEFWLVMQEAKRLLGGVPASQAKAHTEDVLSNSTSVHRYLFTCHVANPCFFGWPHVKTILRVLSETVRDGKVIAREDRYYICSLRLTQLTLDQWLNVVRHHWCVENNAHWTLDAIFQEDKHPWIEADARGVVVFMLLRRIAYNLLALFRSVTQRAEERRATPWRNMLEWVYRMLIATARADVQGLRRRKQAPAFS